MQQHWKIFTNFAFKELYFIVLFFYINTNIKKGGDNGLSRIYVFRTEGLPADNNNEKVNIGGGCKKTGQDSGGNDRRGKGSRVRGISQGVLPTDRLSIKNNYHVGRGKDYEPKNTVFS